MAIYERTIEPPTILAGGVPTYPDITQYADNYVVNRVSNFTDTRAYEGTITITLETRYPLETDPQKVFGNPEGYLGNRAVIFFSVNGKNPTESIEHMYTGPITVKKDTISFAQNDRTVVIQNVGGFVVGKARVKYLGKWSKVTKFSGRIV